MAETLTKSAATRGRLLVVSAAVLWSTSGLFVKGGPLAALPVLERGPMLACYRALFAALFLLPAVRWKSVRWRPMLVPMVLSFAAMNVLIVTALTRTTAAAAIFLQYTSTVWAFVFGFVFLKERIDRGNLIALLAAVCGIAWIVAGDWSSENFAGNLLALGSGACFAGVILCLRWLRDEDSVWLIALNHLFAGVVLLPWVLSFDIRLDATQWMLAAGFGVLQMGLPYVLFARGVRTVSMQEAALIPLIEPILNPVWVWFVWKQPASETTWIGGGLIVGGLAIRYLLFPSRKLTSN